MVFATLILSANRVVALIEFVRILGNVFTVVRIMLPVSKEGAALITFVRGQMSVLATNWLMTIAKIQLSVRRGDAWTINARLKNTMKNSEPLAVHIGMRATDTSYPLPRVNATSIQKLDDKGT